ncbi:uncharacterized protein LOC108864508 [Galendromus occidentalis]|uniref:Uncharacterized protein LOC108864508 n=1 Tax=Galendromus occidentalis TaxID=34638 RepID=A0AAJ7SGX0_9ACAR|nr:uncharacterized protein LOC108864508 [Galendromus occidentalis]
MNYTRILLFVFLSVCYTYQVSQIILVNLEGVDWREEVVETLRKEGNLAEVAISAETHFQFGVSNPTFYFVEFYLKKSSISISHSSLPKYMCFSLNWTSELSMQVVHQNPLIFKSSLLFFWVPENILELDPYHMTMAFHDVDGSSAGERPGIVLEPSGEYVFNIEQREIVYLPKPYDTDCTDYLTWPRHPELKSILTKAMCEHDCKNEILLEKCGCLSEDYPARHLINTTTCWTNSECQKGYSGMIAKTCSKRCGKACHNIIYDAKQAHSKMYDPQEEGEYYIKLILLMTSRNVDVMEFIPALTFTQVLGLIGGYLGLWLGLSLVTIISGTFFFVAKAVVNRIRGDVYNILAVNCIYRTLRFLCMCICVYACGLAIFVDTGSYLKYRTTVRVDRGNLSALEFPALTICNIQAINFSRVCWEYDGTECKTSDPEAILGNRLTLVKELIKFSYPISEFVLACQLKYRDYVCKPADCLHLWKIQYTYLKTGVCYTFDPGLLQEYRDCKEPWKYELSVRLGATSSKEITLSGFLHQQNTFTSAMPNTFMLRTGKIYMVTAEQKTFSALPRPYETQCADYVRIANRMNYTEGNREPQVLWLIAGVTLLGFQAVLSWLQEIGGSRRKT